MNFETLLIQKYLLHPMVFSLGYIFKYLPIKILYQILISKKMVEEPSHRVGISNSVNTLREAVNKSVNIA